MLEKTATKENPVAVIYSQSFIFLSDYALGIKSHFQDDSGFTEYITISRKCLVLIQGRNCMTKWEYSIEQLGQ